MYNLHIFYKGGIYMALIRPCADLRNNYNEISKMCHETKEPVYITKNGFSDLVVLSNEVYESILETEEEKIERIISKHFDEKYSDFEKFQKDFWSHIEQALSEVDQDKCISMKNAMAEMEAKYGIHKNI